MTRGFAAEDLQRLVAALSRLIDLLDSLRDSRTHEEGARRTQEPLTVLFVEDDTGVRDSVATLLGSRGFRVLAAPTAHDALRLLAEHRIDALFTDIVMPGLSGVELAIQARLLYPDLKVCS